MVNARNKGNRKPAESVAEARLTLYITLAFAGGFLLVFLYRAGNNVHRLPLFSRWATWIAMAGAVFTLFSGVWAFSAKKKDVSNMLLTPGTGLFLSLFTLFCGLILKFFYFDAIKLLYVLLPGVCVVYLIRRIYANGFYPTSAFLLFTGTQLFLADRMLLWEIFAPYRLWMGAFIALCGAGFLLICLRCKKGEGMLRVGAWEQRLFRKDESVVPACLAAAAAMALGGALIVRPAYVLFYGLIGLSALAVCLAIYYTSKLIYD
ncbi:MAG: hypothetical protein IJL15_01505 [Clostridia bacterium]|nr:hypothetical protein [Clostridia bacterium]